MCCKAKLWFGVGAALLAGLIGMGGWSLLRARDTAAEKASTTNHEWELPNESWKMPFKDEQPIQFVTASGNPTLWASLKQYWNTVDEAGIDPQTGDP